MAAVAGVLLGQFYGVINPYIGFMAGMKAFTAAVLGGIGSIPGAMIGGLILGIAEALSSAYLSTEYKDVVSFALLILVLLVMPTGILGRPEVEKVLNRCILQWRCSLPLCSLSEDLKMASLLGINTDRVIALTFVIGAAMAAVAGVLLGQFYGVINPYIGFMAGMKAFTAAVLGGIGSIPGAMIGGLILGIAEALSSAYLSTEYKDVVSFALLILVLLVMPTGILGRPEVEKVLNRCILQWRCSLPLCSLCWVARR